MDKINAQNISKTNTKYINDNKYVTQYYFNDKNLQQDYIRM